MRHSRPLWLPRLEGDEASRPPTLALERPPPSGTETTDGLHLSCSKLRGEQARWLDEHVEDNKSAITCIRGRSEATDAEVFSRWRRLNLQGGGFDIPSDALHQHVSTCNKENRFVRQKRAYLR